MMLPFFRKIRWGLARDNQFLKYSRYAIGEIVLVVVGILIALQINNWNEERKARTLENKLLNQFIDDLNEDIYGLEQSIRMSNFAIEANMFILKAAKEQREMDTILENYFTMTTIPFSFFKSESATYDNVKSIGFQVISDDQLRRKIQSGYKAFSAIEEVRANMDLEYLMTMDVESMTKYDQVSALLDPENKKGNQPQDWPTLRSDIVFLNNLANMTNLHKRVVRQNTGQIEYRKELISDIENQLKKN